MSEHRCPKCKVALHRGIATGQTYTGSPDFFGDTRAVTMSPGGPGYVMPCLKCPECGYSITTKE